MKISVFGLGYVGCVSLGCLSNEKHLTIGVDIDENKINKINKGIPTVKEKDLDKLIKAGINNKLIRATKDFKKAILKTDLSIICVGTPSLKNGKLNLKYIYNVARDIGNTLKFKKTFHTISIRSTINPGTSKKITSILEKKSGKKNDKDFSVIVNPEFLREGSAVFDYYNPPLILIGYSSNKSKKIISKVYENFSCKKIFVDIESSEIMKYVNNTFHALKVSFANEIGRICKGLNIDSQNIMKILCEDNKLNISSYYLKPGFAYGGSCLPKDLLGFKTLSNSLNAKTPIINSISKSNFIHINKSIEFIKSFNKKKIGILGLSFKAGTNDMRNSPIINVIEELTNSDYIINIYDKNIDENTNYNINKNITDVIDQSDIIIVSINDRSFLKYLLNINNKPIIDLVCLDHKLFTKSNYHGFLW